MKMELQETEAASRHVEAPAPTRRQPGDLSFAGHLLLDAPEAQVLWRDRNGRGFYCGSGQPLTTGHYRKKPLETKTSAFVQSWAKKRYGSCRGGKQVIVRPILRWRFKCGPSLDL